MFTVSHSVGQTNLPYSEVILGNERKKFPFCEDFRKSGCYCFGLSRVSIDFFREKKMGLRTAIYKPHPQDETNTLI